MLLLVLVILAAVVFGLPPNCCCKVPTSLLRFKVKLCRTTFSSLRDLISFVKNVNNSITLLSCSCLEITLCQFEEQDSVEAKEHTVNVLLNLFDLKDFDVVVDIEVEVVVEVVELKEDL